MKKLFAIALLGLMVTVSAAQAEEMPQGLKTDVQTEAQVDAQADVTTPVSALEVKQPTAEEAVVEAAPAHAPVMVQPQPQQEAAH